MPRRSIFAFHHSSFLPLLLAFVVLLPFVACSRHQGQDSQLTTSIQNRLNADPALQGEQIHASVQNGVATLTGMAQNDSQRAAAEQDANLPGITQVVNEIGTSTAAVAPSAGTGRRGGRSEGAPNVASGAPAPATPSTVRVAAGTLIPVLLNTGLDSNAATVGETYHGVVAAPVAVGNRIAIPQGAAVTGHVIGVHSAGHFKGRSTLSISINEISYNGQTYLVTSQPFTRLGPSRGKRSAEMIGGGGGLGALIGAIAGHGKGAAIGAAAGAGAGAAAQEFTKPAPARIAAETRINFRLTRSLRVQPAAGALP